MSSNWMKWEDTGNWTWRMGVQNIGYKSHSFNFLRIRSHCHLAPSSPSFISVLSGLNTSRMARPSTSDMLNCFNTWKKKAKDLRSVKALFDLRSLVHRVHTIVGGTELSFGEQRDQILQLVNGASCDTHYGQAIFGHQFDGQLDI